MSIVLRSVGFLATRITRDLQLACSMLKSCILLLKFCANVHLISQFSLLSPFSWLSSQLCWCQSLFPSLGAVHANAGRNCPHVLFVLWNTRQRPLDGAGWLVKNVLSCLEGWYQYPLKDRLSVNYVQRTWLHDIMDPRNDSQIPATNHRKWRPAGLLSKYTVGYPLDTIPRLHSL